MAFEQMADLTSVLGRMAFTTARLLAPAPAADRWQGWAELGPILRQQVRPFLALGRQRSGQQSRSTRPPLNSFRFRQTMR